MSKINFLILFGLGLGITGCTRDYEPKTNADGKAIFKAACAECHKAEDSNQPEIFFTLDEKNANPTYIAHKVHSGSIMMPKFPNIKKTKMRMLSKYVLEHSAID